MHMQTLRTIMRVVGRLAIAALILLMVLATYTSQESLHYIYMQKYDNFRRMLELLRIVQLPPARYIQELFVYVYWTDLAFLTLMAPLIMIGKRMGGWMMLAYFGFKVIMLYLPVILNTPRMVFTSRDAFQMMRQVGLLGAAVALTVAPRQQSKVQDEKRQDLSKAKAE